MSSRRFRLRLALLLGLLVAIVGCGADSAPNYSATRFSQCLVSRDIGANDMDTSRSQNRYFDVLHRLAAQAAEQNGALEAFGNESVPRASTAYFLFFRDASEARAAHEQLVPVSAHSEDLTVRENLLSIAASETEAQRRIVGECLGQSSSS
jgi:hypothetical protein